MWTLLSSVCSRKAAKAPASPRLANANNRGDVSLVPPSFFCSEVGVKNQSKHGLRPRTSRGVGDHKSG